MRVSIIATALATLAAAQNLQTLTPVYSPSTQSRAIDTPTAGIPQSGSGNDANHNSDSGCSFCTVPEGYTSETVAAPINITKNFNAKWRKAHRKAATFLADWTFEDKVKLVTGSGWMADRCVGNTPPVPWRNWTGLCLQDGPLGIRFA
jgi:beta-glucosidase